jgi:hypothetical protein
MRCEHLRGFRPITTALKDCCFLNLVTSYPSRVFLTRVEDFRILLFTFSLEVTSVKFVVVLQLLSMYLAEPKKLSFIQSGVAFTYSCKINNGKRIVNRV